MVAGSAPSMLSGHLLQMQILRPSPYLLSQKLWGWNPVIWVLLSLPDYSDAP